MWSGSIGYPGAGQYLEFHRKHGERGLRYHKVTHNKAPLSNKDPYYPDDVPGKVFEHAEHFCNVVRGVLREYRNQTGRTGTVVAPFDAELFGHWWFEGIRFLRDVVLTLNSAGDVKLITTQEALDANPRDKVVRMPEGSWGEKGNHSVWINEQNRWMWEIEYRAEGSLLKALYELPWRKNAKVHDAAAACRAGTGAAAGQRLALRRAYAGRNRLRHPAHGRALDKLQPCHRDGRASSPRARRWTNCRRPRLRRWRCTTAFLRTLI